MVGVIYTANRNSDKSKAVQDQKIEWIGEKIQELKKAQDKHNAVIERTYAVEKQVAELQRDSKTAFNSIEEVKREVDHLSNTVGQLKETEIRLEEKVNKE